MSTQTSLRCLNNKCTERKNKYEECVNDDECKTGKCGSTIVSTGNERWKKVCREMELDEILESVPCLS